MRQLAVIQSEMGFSMKTNTSSSKFIILFIVILLALAALITGVFFYSEYRLVHSGLFDQQCVPEFPIWSNISDLFNLILGVPTALAGSVVALFIAHRAYVISSRQSYYETLQYLEKIVSDSSLLFWNLASDLRRFEDSAQKLIVSVIAHSETEEIQLRSSGDKGFDQGVGTSQLGRPLFLVQRQDFRRKQAVYREHRKGTQDAGNGIRGFPLLPFQRYFEAAPKSDFTKSVGGSQPSK